MSTHVIASPPSRLARLRASPLGGASRRPGRHVHGRPGLLHRQRRDARDAGRPARRHRRARVGRRRLRPRRRRRCSSPPAVSATVRPPAAVLARARPVHARSAACGLAPSAGRARRRAARAGRRRRAPQPQVLSIIGVTYTGDDRVRALSVYGIVLGLAAVGGQLVGGVLVQADVAGLGWRSCFLINVPVGLAAIALAPRLVPESHAGRSSRIDVAGTVLVTAGLTAIMLPLVEGRQHGWPLWTWLRTRRCARPARRVRRPPAPARPPRRRAAARSGAVPRPRLQRRASRPSRVLVRPGVVLPRPRAVPPAGPRARRARRPAWCSRSSRSPTWWHR